MLVSYEVQSYKVSYVGTIIFIFTLISINYTDIGHYHHVEVNSSVDPYSVFHFQIQKLKQQSLKYFLYFFVFSNTKIETTKYSIKW